MATSLDGTSPNGTLASTFSTPSLTLNAPAAPSVNATITSTGGTVSSTFKSSPVPSDHSTAHPLPPAGPTSSGASASLSSTPKQTIGHSDVVIGRSSPSAASSESSATSSETHTLAQTSSKSVESSDDTVSRTTPSPDPPPPPSTSDSSSTSSTKNTPPSTSSTPLQTAQASGPSSNASPSTSTHPGSSEKSSNVAVSSNAPTSTGSVASTETGANQAKSELQSTATDASITGSLTSSGPQSTATTGNASAAGTPAHFVTHFSTLTSDGRVYTSTSVSPEATGVLTATQGSGFFANHGAVAGVFLIVALAALGLLGLLIYSLVRCRRRRNIPPETRSPTLPTFGSESSDHEPHYRRMSQMLALSDVLSAGAAGVGAGRLHARISSSDDSHAFSGESFSSMAPINGEHVEDPFANHHAVLMPVRELEDAPPHPSSPPKPGPRSPLRGAHLSLLNTIPNPSPPTTNAYPQTPDLSPLTPDQQDISRPFASNNPFANNSRHSLDSGRGSTPSIYPPTLDDDDDEYGQSWPHRGYAPTPPPNVKVEEHGAQQRQLPRSPLGLWTDTSQTSMTQHNTSEENELVRSLDPRMEPTSSHKGTTAPIAFPPGLAEDVTQHVLHSGWAVPNRDY